MEEVRKLTISCGLRNFNITKSKPQAHTHTRLYEMFMWLKSWWTHNFAFQFSTLIKSVPIYHILLNLFEKIYRYGKTPLSDFEGGSSILFHKFDILSIALGKHTWARRRSYSNSKKIPHTTPPKMLTEALSRGGFHFCLAIFLYSSHFQ